MKDKLFVALTRGLLCAGWAFAVLHGAPALEQLAKDQLQLHRRHYDKTGGIYNAEMIPVDHNWRPLPLPTWPRWIAKSVYEAAGFADNYPYWTILTGVGIVAWGRLYRDRVKTRPSRFRDSPIDVRSSAARQQVR